MKGILIIVILFFGSLLNGQNLNPKYDSTLAKKVEADKNGMKMYVLVLLKTGTAKIEDKVVRDSLFRGHFSNMKRMADDGKLVVAGPFDKNTSDFRGLFILNVRTLEEANLLLQSDPTVKANVLKPETYLWYGSAALGEYLDEAEKVSQFSN